MALARAHYDAVVVGSGPNGLAAAVTVARAGRSVLVVEAEDDIGGGTRSRELTLPGFVHDVCSAVHPLAASSPVFRALPLRRHGLEWVHPEVVLAHPLDGGRAGLVERDAVRTAARLGPDERAWRRCIAPLAKRWDDLGAAVLAPLTRAPRHPVLLARFGLPALLPSTVLARSAFRTDEARAVFAGCAAHSFLPLERMLTSAFGLILLASAHGVGWPVARGGSRAIAAALAAHLRELGGEIVTGRRVDALGELPSARAVLFDLAPRQVAAIAGDALTPRYRRRLERFRHGPAVFKVDYALDGPVPWTNPGCRLAGTVHLGGTLDEIRDAEADVAAGRHPTRPFVLVAQQSAIDPTRAPDGSHTLWAYCHVPNGSTVDMTEAIEGQIERFAPGFRDLVRARHVAGPGWFEAHDRALVGGDISGGSNHGLQMVVRPVPRLRPHRTPNPRLFLCSASTPPGGGVHGMCGFHAAQEALGSVLS